MTTIYILDVDGTVADCEHRARLFEFECNQCLTRLSGLLGDWEFVCTHCGCQDGRATDASWEVFNSPDLMFQDTPLAGAQKGVKALEALGHPVHYLTARGPEHHEVTLKWLQQHFDFDSTKQILQTRVTSERLNSAKFKEQMVEKLKFMFGEQYENPTYVFVDDKVENLQMFARHGLAFQSPAFWQAMHT